MLKLELTEQQMQVIAAALGAMPFQTVAPVIQELQRQVSAQQAAKMPEPKVE